MLGKSGRDRILPEPCDDVTKVSTNWSVRRTCFAAGISRIQTNRFAKSHTRIAKVFIH